MSFDCGDAGFFILIGVGATLIILGGMMAIDRDIELMERIESFCESHGWDFDYNKCHKIVNDTYIEREVKIIDEDIYWLEEDK